MEHLFNVENPLLNNNQSSIKPLAFILPNQNVDYDNERTSIIRGSCFSMYTAKYVSNLDDFEIGVTYIDTINVQNVNVEFLFYSKEVENGITANMEMHQTVDQQVNISKIQLYFHYDYENQTALDTTIVSFSANSIALAKLDYQTEEAISYEINASESEYSQIKTALSQGSFDFDKFIEREVLRYKFVKMQVKEKTMQAYSYIIGQEGQVPSVTEDEFKSFYNNVYSNVKNECIERDFLDKATATNKVYYEAMFNYASQEVRKLA